VRLIFFVVTAIVCVAGCGIKSEEKTKSSTAPSRSHEDSFVAAVASGNVAAVKKHLRTESTLKVATPLQVAIESQSSGRAEMVALLLTQGLDANKPDSTGLTPVETLKRVAENSAVNQQITNRRVAQLLVKYGAKTSPEFRKKFGMQAAHTYTQESSAQNYRECSKVLFGEGRLHQNISQNATLRFLLRGLKPVHSADQQPKRVLFIGNSYTHAIRSVMPALLKAQGHITTVEFVTPGGAQLIKHLNTPKTVNLIKTGNWDVVVFQEQSQTPACPGRLRKLFMKGASGLHELTKENDSQTVFFNTWGYINGDKRNFTDDTYSKMQKRLNVGYGAAANKFDAQLAPVGDAYTELKITNPKLWARLYQADGSHPSRTGAYLAAIVIYCRLYGVDPQKISFNGGLNESVATQLKASAARALKETAPAL
tara:strand:+ start:544 stop:1818 length:1275 start_codon:yes stop_codon:yes gene_type:complete